jgi:PAS domain S-box-containing protein
MNARVPAREAERLQALRRYSILDTPPDGTFDHITALAAELFRVPIALISLVDHDRIWFKSRHGLDAQQIARDPGLCASAIFSPDVYYVRDGLTDPRTLANPLVAGEMGLRFYAAAPLRTHDNFNLGTLCIIDREPRDLTPAERTMLAKLASVVMDQMELRRSAMKIADLEESERQMGQQLRQANEALAQSEERFRDLFDEAPIAYVHEGLDSRFIRANRAAMRILGIRPEEITATYGKSFVPNTPDAQLRLREAFESVDRGKDTSGVVLELRRKDNGKPVWIQWWSKPDRSGAYTRTMFVDITDRVLMEQEQARLQAQNAYLREEIRSEHNFGEIVGNSPALLEVLRQVDQVAPTDSTALIIGDTGTGKELLARAIHDHSMRKGRPLVKMNCAAISAGLVESELFGHVKGAFTGALTNRDGRFKVADGGTIFLDEVGELPLETQVKLLRVLQEREFEPVGSSKSIRVDVRVIAASNRNLEESVRAGRFRADLFYRLNVFPLQVPPLTERRSDIRQLVMFFLSRFSQRFGKKVTSVSDETMERLIAYRWPGNIRELQNVIERAVVVARGPVLELDRELGPLAVAAGHEEAKSAAAAPAKFATLEEVERNHIVAILKQTEWVIEGPKGAAQILKLHPNTLRSRMGKLGIRRNSREAS